MAGSDFTPLPLTKMDDSSEIKSNYPDNMVNGDKASESWHHTNVVELH